LTRCEDGLAIPGITDGDEPLSARLDRIERQVQQALGASNSANIPTPLVQTADNPSPMTSEYKAVVYAVCLILLWLDHHAEARLLIRNS
jgi:hypothetical protein